MWKWEEVQKLLWKIISQTLFEIATVEGTRKWILRSGYLTKQEAFQEGAKAYEEQYYRY